jgi:tetraacyldisaccharide 4'-kinase
MAFLYGLGVRIRIASIKRKKKRELPGFVLSVGNLTVGGTGKTPTSIMVAEWARNEGHRVSILSRGYRGSYKEKVLVVSDADNHIRTVPEKSGDEPYLMARRLGGVPVIISKDRYLAGLTAHQEFGSDFFILDDGFQHIILKRDFDLVLVDSSIPFGNGHLLPLGPLREPVSQIKRADAIILKGSGDIFAGNNKEALFKQKPLFVGDHIPEKIVFPLSKKSYDPGFLKGKRVMAFAGIARPEAFKNTLKRLGADVAGFRIFRDHHYFGDREIRDLKKEKGRVGAELMITTEKDWVRLKGIGADYSDLAYLTINFSLLSGRDEFFNMIDESIKKRYRV